MSELTWCSFFWFQCWKNSSCRESRLSFQHGPQNPGMSSVWDSFEMERWRTVRNRKFMLLFTFSSQLFCTWKIFIQSLWLGRKSQNVLIFQLKWETAGCPLRRGGTHFFVCCACFVVQERRFRQMLKDAGIPDIKQHLVKGKSLKPLVQQYEEALSKLERTVKVSARGKNSRKWGRKLKM